jgi:phosphoenolpyruvate-protein kinase (PTS system EI component)
MMTDPYQVVRDFVRKALLDSGGDWNAAEHLCHRRLLEDPALKEQMAQVCVEWVIRNVITAEGRRQQQQAADRLREERATADRERDIKQTVDEFLQNLWGRGGGDKPSTV